MFGKKKEVKVVESNVTTIVNGTYIHGNVYSQASLVIEGGIKGDVFGSQVHVKPAGWVQGTLTCCELVIEPGGVVDGEVKVAENNNTNPQPLDLGQINKKALPEPKTGESAC